MVVRESKALAHAMENERHKCQTCDNGSALCMNIWNKFGLGPPTPPGSPPHETISDFPGLEGFNLGDDVEFFDSKEEDVLATMKHIFESSQTNLQSNLIQDCMWSGNLAKEYNIDQRSNCSSSFDANAAGDCVDPQAVFPYPIHSITDRYMTETRVDNIGGLETPSDSEEEIDVVTVQREQRMGDFEPSKIRKSTTIPVRCIKIEKEDSDYTQGGKSPVKTSVTPKAKIECPPDVHNYSLPHSHSLKRVRSSPASPAGSIPSSKRLKRELSAPEFQKRLCQKLSRAGTNSSCSSASSSRSSSDSEECCEGGKRTQHNVLERKRRNDLKFSFFTLRDSVPELSLQERAPKVLILKKAADHIHKLNHTSSVLESERDLLRSKNEQLRRTLSKLQSRDF